MDRLDPGSDPIPLDGDTPLRPEEIYMLRKMMMESARATWAMRKLRVLIPVGVSIVVGCWQLWEWVVKHLKVVP